MVGDRSYSVSKLQATAKSGQERLFQGDVRVSFEGCIGIVVWPRRWGHLFCDHRPFLSTWSVSGPLAVMVTRQWQRTFRTGNFGWLSRPGMQETGWAEIRCSVTQKLEGHLAFT